MAQVAMGQVAMVQVAMEAMSREATEITIREAMESMQVMAKSARNMSLAMIGWSL